MKQIILSQEEALVIIKILSGAYIAQDDEDTIFELITKIKKELGLE